MAEEEKKNNETPEITSTEEKTTGTQSSQKINPLGILCYLGILVLIPWFTAKDDEFIKFHVKQGLTLFIAEVITVIVGLIPLIGWILAFIGWIIWLILTVLGIVNVLKGEKKSLPLIGKYAESWKI